MVPLTSVVERPDFAGKAISVASTAAGSVVAALKRPMFFKKFLRCITRKISAFINIVAFIS
jgi:hypothetical protein